MKKLILALLLLIGAIASAQAWLIQAPSGAPAAPSCNAIITGSATGSAILTGTATALANLTCQ